jgi:hypothetical protein
MAATSPTLFDEAAPPHLPIVSTSSKSQKEKMPKDQEVKQLPKRERKKVSRACDACKRYALTSASQLPSLDTNSAGKVRKRGAQVPNHVFVASASRPFVTTMPFTLAVGFPGPYQVPK